MNQWMNLNELKSYQHLDQNGRVDLTRAMAGEEGTESIIFTIKDKNDKHYKIVIDVEDFEDMNVIEGAKKNIIKKVTAKVIYSMGNNLKNVEISTIISKK